MGDRQAAGEQQHGQARTRRNRQALVQAMLALIRETGAPPIAEEVAERAGVSRRTVFRLFQDMEAVHAAAHELIQAEVTTRYPPPDLSALTPRERIAALVDHIGNVYEFVGPVRRMAEQQRHDSRVVAERLRTGRADQGRNLALAFADLLRSHDPDERATRLSAIRLLLDWQSWNNLRDSQRLSVKRAKRTLEASLCQLLIP